MQEQRRFVRLAPSLVVVTCNVIGQEGEGDSQTANDISQGGVRFLVGERLSNGARLELELKLPEEAVPIQAQAEVVWCARFRDDGHYEVGCRFIQIDPLDRGKIIRYIHEGLKQRKPWA
jgi:c-di-GMP-binding flagellar brake protein YcgR